MRPVNVGELLPGGELLREVDIVAAREELTGLEPVAEVEAFDLAVQVRAPRLDVDIAHVLVFDVPLELRRELVAAVAAHRVAAQGKARDQVLDEVDGVRLGVPLGDRERPDSASRRRSPCTGSA